MQIEQKIIEIFGGKRYAKIHQAATNTWKTHGANLFAQRCPAPFPWTPRQFAATAQCKAAHRSNDGLRDVMVAARGRWQLQTCMKGV